MKVGAKISALAVAVFFSVYYFFGLENFIAFIAAVLVHELGHVTGILLFGGKVKNIRLEAGGFSIDSAGVINKKAEIAVFAAGPLFGLALAILCVKLPAANESYLLIAVGRISLALSIYNMLPALPLDGGRIIECVLASGVGSKKTKKTLEITGTFFGAAIVLFGAYYSKIILIGGGVWLLIAQTGIVKNRRVL